MDRVEAIKRPNALDLIDLPEARRLVAELTRNNQPLPDDLHERSLLLELDADPFNIDTTASLISLLSRLDRPPLPDGDLLRNAPGITAASPADTTEELLRQAAGFAETGDLFRDYACLWQIVVRYPHSNRGWAEYARRFAERREWPLCRLALSHALNWPSAGPRPDTLTAVSILAALTALALNQELGEVAWRDWIDRLPDDLAPHPSVANVMLWTGDLKRAVSLLPSLKRREPPEADSWIVAANIAYEREDWAEAYQCWHRAFEADLPRTLRSVIVDHSARFANIFSQTDGADELADWLTAQWDRHRGVNLIPDGWAPESAPATQARRDRALERGLPSVLLIPQGKSASVSVASLFNTGFGLPTAIYSLTVLRVVAPWLADYLSGGACYATHLMPIERNIELLAAGGARSIIVHVRDPRQAAISFAGHIKQYASEVLPVARSLGSFQDTGVGIIREECIQTARWIDGWVGARAKLNIEFTTFEEFVGDRDAFVERCLSLYGGDRRYFDREAALQEHASVDYHRRSGRTDEWRELLTAQQTERLNRLIPDRLWGLFGWEP